MPLPESGGQVKWPPQEWQQVYTRYREHAAWFSSSPSQLAGFYYAGAVASGAGFWRTNFDRFWARSPAPQTRLMLHVPLAAALASVSSDLLFAEPPDFVIPTEEKDSARVQDRLNQLVEAVSINRTLSELGETVAALGGGFLRVIWDKTFEAEHPMLGAVDADAAIPDFRWGRMTAVTFWTRISATGPDKAVWRHLERHEPGVILTGLYKGTDQYLGERMPVDSLPGLNLPDPEVETGIEGLTAVYVPNVRPNRVFRGSPLGRSDYDGVESEMDSLDEIATSLMRDFRLGRARLIVPQEMLETQGKGKGAKFDLDQEVWEAIPLPGPTFGMDNLINPSQFLIRSADHLSAMDAKVQQIVEAAGYSPASFGLEARKVIPQTATEIVNRERQSFLTRGKKIAYWTQPLEAILEALLAIDAIHFQSHPVYRPRVDFADSIRDDMHQMASTVHILRSAEAVSIEERVRMVHPKWTNAEVAAEAKRIQDEGGKSMGGQLSLLAGSAAQSANGQSAPTVAPLESVPPKTFAAQ